MMIIKLLLTVFFLAVLPVLAGSVARRLAGAEYGSTAANIITAFLFGQLLLWALFEPGTVLLILAGKPLSYAILVWAGLVLAFCAGGLLFLYRRGKTGQTGGISLPAAGVFDTSGKYYARRPFFAVPEGQRLQFCIALCAAAVLIGWQCWKYFFQMHTDDDDSRFIAEAVEAWQKNTMLRMNPATGEAITGFPGEIYKDVTSPWMMYLAMLAKLCRIHPAIFAHTIWPVCLLLLCYAAYYLIGLTLFDGDRAHGMFFTAAVAFLQMFFGGSTHTQAAFTLVRIWQGKAAFAAIGIPSLFLLFQGIYASAANPCQGTAKAAWDEKKSRQGARWFFLLFLTETAVCVMSGMGIVLGAFSAGIFGLWYTLSFRRLRQIPLWIICVLPNIVLALMNVYLKS